MVGCEFLSSQGSSYSRHFVFFILGLIIALTSYIEATKVDCSIFSKYQHCRIHPAGVHDLDCFIKYNNIDFIKCVWKPGNQTSENYYTLIILQHSLSNHKEVCHIGENVLKSKNVNITAEIFEISESRTCTKAVFRGLSKSLTRCGPPHHVSFRRHSGNLNVNVTWQQEDSKVINSFSVRYKTLNSQSWEEQCQKGTGCVGKNLNSSLTYNVQIKCVPNEKCSQCPWSETYTVPPELTTQPEIVRFEDKDFAKNKGKRQIFLTWMFSASELYDSYYVTIEKASGEAPCQRMSTTHPEITMILSYSAFRVNITAVNNVSTSPAVSKTIPWREDTPGIGDGRLNVTVHNNTSFTVSWKDNLIKTYVCYCVEWRKKGQKALYKSFFQNEVNNRTISNLPERLEPYERYTITLHTRPNRNTCDMKRVNDSESTYGSKQFYFIEGTPVSAPNISGDNLSLNSVVLEWSPIPEEDIRGFLLGYTISYMEYQPRDTEINITVEPELNNYQLGDLKSGTAYEVQISGFTKAGAGVRSTSYVFKTNQQELSDLSLSGVITIYVAVITVLVFGPAIIKRTKVIVWPSIPNPGNSNAMQKIEGACELELLESINTLKVEEWDTNSLQIVEKEAAIPANVIPFLHTSKNEGDSAEMTCNWIQRDTEDVTGGFLPDATTGTCSHVPQTELHSPPLAFSSEYTTMEMFNQLMPQGIPADTDATQSEESESEDTELTVVKTGMDYIRQFSTSPTLESELSTIL